MTMEEKLYIERRMSREEGRQEGRKEVRQEIIEKLRKTGMPEEQIKLILAD